LRLLVKPLKALRHVSHRFTYKQQDACLDLVSVHQMLSRHQSQSKNSNILIHNYLLYSNLRTATVNFNSTVSDKIVICMLSATAGTIDGSKLTNSR